MSKIIVTALLALIIAGCCHCPPEQEHYMILNGQKIRVIPL